MGIAANIVCLYLLLCLSTFVYPIRRYRREVKRSLTLSNSLLLSLVFSYTPLEVGLLEIRREERDS
jgi:hypothetical protein